MTRLASVDPPHFFDDPVVWDTIYQRSDINSRIHLDRLTLATAIVDGLSLPTGAAVLDVGCGAGQFTVALARRQLRVVAVDHHWEMLDKACRRIAMTAPAGVVIAQADAARLPVADGRFDLVVALGVLPWVNDPTVCMAEWVRVLRPGGALLVTISNRLRLPWLLDPLHTPALAGPRRHVKRLSAVLGHPLSARRGPIAHALSRREFRDLVVANDVEPIVSRTLGFGPFTLFSRPVLPLRSSVRLHGLLQSAADKGLPALGAVGAQHLLVGRKTGD